MKGLGNLEIVKSSKKGTWKFSKKVKRLMNILWNTHEGIREQGYCEIAEKGNLEILRKSKTAHEGNCEMLMKGLGNLEIVKSSKKGTWKFSEKVKWLMKEI